ncbi:hypothetical protein [Plantactinospora sp. CA-290183]|uniref:hypothetical protein n=1 Tax=Plantactinospora sp. CA-290183 TaxID=3240006 RepID=UPI003D8A2EB6
MARRRSASVRATTGDPPAHLLRWEGQFVDDTEPVPDYVPAREAASWRNIQGWGRWRKARKQWCEENGRHYWTTFYPPGRVVDRG